MIAFTFNGTRCEAREGQTIAAALTAAGVGALGRPRGGPPRGGWGGLGGGPGGIVAAAGEPSRRACMEKAVDGMIVTSQGYLVDAPPAHPSPLPTPVTERPQVLIVGAGPAGLAAARAAALCGAKVTVVDERAIPG